MPPGAMNLPSPSPRNTEGTHATDAGSLRKPARVPYLKVPITWLIILVLAGLTHPFLPENRWLMIHIFTLGVLVNSIIIWSAQITEQIYHQRPVPQVVRQRGIILAVLNLGIIAVIAGQLLSPDLGWDSPLMATGAILIAAMVLVHLWQLWRLRREAPIQSRARFDPTLWLFSAGQLLLVLDLVDTALVQFGSDGAQVGVKATEFATLSHLITNIFGFIGLTAAGALALLFPTIWRTRGDFCKDRMVAVILIAGISIATLVVHLGSLLPARLAFTLTAIALLIYAGGWLLRFATWIPLIRKVSADPRDRVSFAALSITAARAWLFFTVLTVAGTLFRGEHPTLPAVALLVGFAAQLLIGTMSFLLPNMMGGPAHAVRAGLYRLDAAGLYRFTLVNGGLALWLLPASSSWLKVVASLLCVASLAAFLPLLLSARRLQRKALAEQQTHASAKSHSRTELRTHSRTGQITAGVATLALVLGLFTLADSTPNAASTASQSTTEATGTTEVTVTAEDMHFTPDHIEVPSGHRLLLTVVNADPQQDHDLRLANGMETGRMSPGDEIVLDAGVITAPLEGWCTIAGHRIQGMTLQITTDGTSANDDASTTTDHSSSAHSNHANHAASSGSLANPETLDPELVLDPSLAPAPPQQVHELAIDITETTFDIDGMTRGRWTFNGGLMGPTIRGKVGDIFEVTVSNHGSMNHSIDFHAGMVSPDEVMRNIPPGDSLVYRFRAEHAGAWLYHCGTAPMSMHVAAGMYGAVIIDPPNLAPVDHEYILVQSEVYGLTGTSDHPVEETALQAGTPDATVFNGLEFGYLAQPLTIKAGETARFWIVNAGPNIATAFHIVGTQFHTVYKEGAYLLKDAAGGGGSQALDLLAAQGGFVEARFPEAGTYTFVNHQFIDAERGAKGQVIVE